MREWLKIFTGALIGVLVYTGFVFAHSIGGSGISGSVVKTGPCATGYTRSAPNFCKRALVPGSIVALVRDTCTTVAAPSADAKLVGLHSMVLVKSANAVANRSTRTRTYTESSCTTTYDEHAHINREQVAIASGTTIGETNVDINAIVVSGNIYINYTDDIGNQGTAFYYIKHYWD